MESEKVALRVRVRRVRPDCSGCDAGPLGLCSLCAGLCEDESGAVWVCSTPIENGGWVSVESSRLSRAPRVLLIE